MPAGYLAWVSLQCVGIQNIKKRVYIHALGRCTDSLCVPDVYLHRH